MESNTNPFPHRAIGHGGNGPGRPKDAPNKLTREIKDIIQQILDCTSEMEVEHAVARLWKDDPRSMINFLAKVAPKSLEVATKPGRPVEFIFSNGEEK
jgi:hypothetical protein